MKKKILILFLICCMMFSIASPAMAAEETFPSFTPSNEGVDYYIFKGTHTTSLDEYPNHEYVAVETFDYGRTYDFDYVHYIAFENGEFSRFIFTNPDGSTSGRSRYILYIYDGNSWKVAISGSGSPSGFTDNGTNINHQYFVSSSNVTFDYLCDSSEAIYYAYRTPNLNGYDNYYDLTSTVFRQAPPDPMVILAEQMMKKTPEALDLPGKMMTLAPFGISCLALLISLPILSKVLRRFLN